MAQPIDAGGKTKAQLAARKKKRRERRERWDRPLDTLGRRVAAYADMLVIDHGLLRYAYLNLHEFAPGAWRAAQPGPRHFAQLARRGVRTIVNARAGREFGSWPLERESCARHGLILDNFIVTSRGLPKKPLLLGAREFFASLKKPVLFHCKSGADRAGFVAALYMLLHEGRSATEAMRQLHWRYGHFRFARTGILDAFFEAFRDEGEAQGLAFEDWVRDVYDPARIAAAFKPHWLSTLLADRLLKRE
jgi:protein tyrosine phosphatase (PTP) superfamily phosphohydrolase (DUF442 family)